MKYIILFLFLFKSSLSISQCKTVNMYAQLSKAKSDSEKLNIYIEMNKSGFDNVFSSIIEYAFKLKKNKIGNEYLKKGIKKGLTIHGDYTNYIPGEILEKVKKKYPKWRSVFYSTYDEEMYNKVLYLVNTDQYLAKEDFYGGRKQQYPIRNKVFQNNLTQLRYYLIAENKGLLPHSNQIGNLTTAISLMFMHRTCNDSIDEVNFNFFEPRLKEEICSGKTYSPYTYLQLVDNMQSIMEKGMPQVYGHFRNYKTKKIHLLKYPEKVDSLRASIGLPSLREYAKEKGFLLPDNYIEQ